MGYLNYYLSAFSLMLLTLSSVNAEWLNDQGEVSIKTGVITDTGVKMGHGRGEHLMYIDLNDASRWEMVDFDQASDLNWEVGDNIKIYYDADRREQSGENLDKRNHAYLILLKS